MTSLVLSLLNMIVLTNYYLNVTNRPGVRTSTSVNIRTGDEVSKLLPELRFAADLEPLLFVELAGQDLQVLNLNQFLPDPAL